MVSSMGEKDPTFRTVSVPMDDTGIGQEAGYANDRAFLAAAEAERALLPESVRAAVEEFDRAMSRAFFFGPDR